MKFPGIETGDYLGEGDDAVVFAAFRDGKEFAIKVFYDDIDTKAWEKKIEDVEGLSKPPFVRYHEIIESEDGKEVALLMDRAHGANLDRAIKNGKLAAESARLSVATQIVDALQWLHGLNLLHGDVRAQNIVLQEDGQIVFVDLMSDDTTLATELTHIGYVIGQVLMEAEVHDDEITDLIDRSANNLPMPKLEAIAAKAFALGRAGSTLSLGDLKQLLSDYVKDQGVVRAPRAAAPLRASLKRS